MGHVRVRAPVHARLPGRLRGRARKSSQCPAARLYEPVPPRLALARLFGGTGSMGEDFLSRAASGAHALPVSKRSGAMHLGPPATGVGKRPYTQCREPTIKIALGGCDAENENAEMQRRRSGQFLVPKK